MPQRNRIEHFQQEKVHTNLAELYLSSIGPNMDDNDEIRKSFRQFLYFSNLYRVHYLMSKIEDSSNMVYEKAILLGKVYSFFHDIRKSIVSFSSPKTSWYTLIKLLLIEQSILLSKNFVLILILFLLFAFSSANTQKHLKFWLINWKIIALPKNIAQIWASTKHANNDIQCIRPFCKLTCRVNGMKLKMFLLWLKVYISV